MKCPFCLSGHTKSHEALKYDAESDFYYCGRSYLCRSCDGTFRTREMYSHDVSLCIAGYEAAEKMKNLAIYATDYKSRSESIKESITSNLRAISVEDDTTLSYAEKIKRILRWHVEKTHSLIIQKEDLYDSLRSGDKHKRRRFHNGLRVLERESFLEYVGAVHDYGTKMHDCYKILGVKLSEFPYAELNEDDRVGSL